MTRRGSQNKTAQRAALAHSKKLELKQQIRQLYAKGNPNVTVLFIKRIIKMPTYWKQLPISNETIEATAKRIHTGHVIIVDKDTLEVVCVARFNSVSKDDAVFLANFFAILAKYSNKVKSNGSLKHGTMYATGHRRAYHKDYIAGIYSPNQATQRSHKKEIEWIRFLHRTLGRVEGIFRNYFKDCSEPLYHTMTKTANGIVPTMSTMEYPMTRDEDDNDDSENLLQIEKDDDDMDFFQDSEGIEPSVDIGDEYERVGGIQSNDFASNLTWTLHDFYNKLHKDRDANPYAYGIWMTTFKDKITTDLNTIGVNKGHFYIPEYNFYIDFGNNIVEIIWRGRTDFHCTTPSSRNSGYERIGSSIQIARSLLTALSGEYDKKYKGLRETVALAAHKK